MTSTRTRAAALIDWARRHERMLLPVGLVLALAAYDLTPAPALSLVWLALVAALTWRSPRVTLALLPLTFPFWFVPKRVYGHLVFPLSEIALVVCVAVVAGLVAGWLIRARRTLNRERLWRAARGLLARLGPATAFGGALLLVGMTLGVVIARRPHDALRAWRWEIVEPLVYLLLAAWYLRGRRWARLTLWALVGSGLVIAALATAQTLGLHVTFAPVAATGQRLISYRPTPGAPYRVTAIIYGSPNSAGAWLERALPVALAIALLGRGLARGERLLAAVATLALLPALYWTDSRGAWLGAAAGLGLVALVWLAPIAVGAWEGVASRDILTYRVWRWPVLVAALAALMMLGSLVWSAWGAALARIATAGHADTGAVRLLLWQAALNMIRDHPLMGVGPDQFLYYYDPAYTSHPYLISRVNGHPTVAVLQPNLAHPHNLLLDLWLSAGLLGLIGYVVVVVALVRRALRLLRRVSEDHSQPWRRVAAVGVLGALLATLTHGMVDSAYFLPDLALAFWWGVAALIALNQEVARRRV
ncbi:MAG TPA: O-antigen ligase family protein [Ktedonobacterales bacterium]|nr:O-antigen ligase family protein [Ktedonobacterales bacterium]